MDDKRIKGAAIIGLLNVIKKKWGKIGVEEAMKYAELENTPKNGDWVPLTKMYRLLEWVDKNKGENYIFEIGRKMPRVMGET